MNSVQSSVQMAGTRSQLKVLKIIVICQVTLRHLKRESLTSFISRNHYSLLRQIKEKSLRLCLA